MSEDPQVAKSLEAWRKETDSYKRDLIQRRMELDGTWPPDSPEEALRKKMLIAESRHRFLGGVEPGWLVDMGIGTAQAQLVLGPEFHRFPLVRRVQDWWFKSAAPICILCGESGRGKTVAAVAIMPQACVETILGLFGEGAWFNFRPWALLLSAAEVTTWSLFDKSDKKRHEKAIRRKLLVLDDLGAESKTEQSLQMLLDILDKRLVDGKRTIITTNLGPRELQERYSGRVWRRLLDNAQFIEPEMEDRRVGAPTLPGNPQQLDSDGL